MTSFIILITLFIVGVILLARILPSKGAAGEKQVARILSKLPNERYKVINNLLINPNGHSSQIDHVVVSEYGIFVIETKFYNGWIYGSDRSEYWTQNIYGHKYHLYNPIFQNYGHIRALQKLLNERDASLFIPIVAFSRQATLKIQTNELVIYWRYLNDVIKGFQQTRISTHKAQELYEILLASNRDSKENRQEHIRKVQTINRSISNTYYRRCPKCGGKLVRKKGKYGQFYGCENYPNCKFTSA